MTKHSGGILRDDRDDQRFVDDDLQWTWGFGHHDFGDHNHDGHQDHGQHVLHVGADEQFTTIQSAVDAAQNGDLILVDAGTYTEQVTIIGKDLTIKGQGDATHIVAPTTLSANIDDTGSGTPARTP